MSITGSERYLDIRIFVAEILASTHAESTSNILQLLKQASALEGGDHRRITYWTNHGCPAR